ncbi:alkaline phosphatase family protein [Rhodoferax sp. 4810]|uniref:Alkaline phosphatase family protein n=1 Tax=Thiospirillum jenense TaxID=1653858 RepID=A0A839HJ59_9GAMM|nr:alkaline phosphatase family protein [Thiospirillum jenense]MBB1075804.1 alkaline phosphatase family protein [Rhodoferax jenense]MBB1126878.1 alkaline phosphatase family protein [Thiospirillum jenense]
MILPNYHDGSLVNLMAAIQRARGGSTSVPDPDLLSANQLNNTHHLVLLVIDGLGYDWLQRHSPAGILNRHCIGSLTSVFPTTTAAAITTFLTGVAPQQHAITGWFTWLRELGCIMRVLPGQPRYGGVDYQRAGVDLSKLFHQPPVFNRLPCATAVISPREIAYSPFNQTHRGCAELIAYNSLQDLFSHIQQAVHTLPAPSYIYAYWSRLDSVGHHHGINSAASIAHLGELESEITRLIKQLAGTDSVLLVTADHGQIDSTLADEVQLSDHPVLMNCLQMPLCGEPRAAFCYVRPNYVDTFVNYCHDVLGEQFTLYRSAELIENGWFGMGAAHPELIHRIGDYLLLGQGRAVIRDRLLTEQPFTQIGVHGGLSRDELFVPLCVFS